MNVLKKIGWLVPALVLAATACGRSDSAGSPATTLVVAGNSEAVNSFVAESLEKHVPSTMTVAHRGHGEVATFALAGLGKGAVTDLTRQALAHQLSYSVTVTASRG